MMKLAVLLCCAALVSASAGAQLQITKVYNEVGIDQKLGDTIPLDLPFRDESGKAVMLRDYFGGKPVILSLVYYQCPMLCTEVLNGMAGGFQGLTFTAGREFNVVTVSINPRETPDLAAEKKETYMRAYGRPEAVDGWHFLTGKEEDIRALANAVGFHYLYDSTSDQ